MQSSYRQTTLRYRQALITNEHYLFYCQVNFAADLIACLAGVSAGFSAGFSKGFENFYLFGRARKSQQKVPARNASKVQQTLRKRFVAEGTDFNVALDEYQDRQLITADMRCLKNPSLNRTMKSAAKMTSFLSMPTLNISCKLT